MTTEASRQVVTQFLDRFNAGDFDAAFALMADDATWWLPTDVPGGMTMSKRAMHASMGTLGDAFRESPKMVRGRVTAEDDRVSVEQHSRGGVTRGGASYANDYHMLFQLRDGLIVEVREYMNPVLAAAFMAELQGGAAGGSPA